MFDFDIKKEPQNENVSEQEKTFFNGFDKPLEDFEVPPEPEEEFTETFFDDEPITIPKFIIEAKKKAAHQIVNIVSSGLDAVLQMYTGVNEFERYKPPTENLKEIESYVVDMLPDRTPEMPKWLFVLIAIFAAYSPIVSKVKQDKQR